MADAGLVLRVPPHSIEAEQSVIGALLSDNSAMDAAEAVLRREDFYAQDHACIYGAVLDLVRTGKPADVVTVFERLQGSKGGVGAAVELAYLNDCAQSVPSAANITRYAEIVRERALRRRVIALGDRLAGAAFAPSSGGVGDAELPGVIDSAIQELADIEQGRQEAVPRRLAELMPGWLDELSARAEGKTDAISLGLRGVNRVLAGGLRRGDLMVLGARPSMGKSAFTLGITRAVSTVDAVLMCSLEDSASMLISRHVASTGRTPLEHVRVPQHAPDSMWQAVADAAEELATLPIYVDDRAGLSLQQVVQKAKYVQRKAGGLGLVVVDYLQLMEDEGETRSNELARIVRGLKNMAKRLNCAVMLLSQLSREADKTNAPPRLDHLAESGAIEQAADVIGLLWRESRRNPKPDNQNKAQIEFAKNKNGATDTVQLWFDGRTQRFGDLSDEGAD